LVFKFEAKIKKPFKTQGHKTLGFFNDRTLGFFMLLRAASVGDA